MDREHSVDELEPDTAMAAWGLALSIGIEAEPEDRCEALDELGDALLVWADEDTIQRLTLAAVVSVWKPELEELVREGLHELAKASNSTTDVAVALEEFDALGKGSRIAHAVVQHLAQAVGHEGLSPFFCLCCLDEVIAHASPHERRRMACAAAEVAARDVDIGDDELRAAVRGSPSVTFAASLATDERRAAVRARLRRIARLGQSSLPALSREVTAMLDEPSTDDPADDPLWAALSASLVERLEPAFS